MIIHARRYFNVFIGYDVTQRAAYEVCWQSLVDHGVDPACIHPLHTGDLRRLGVYWRPSDPKASTDFTYTRFLVPFLSGYSGLSLFCDSDFLWRCNPVEDLLFKYRDNATVSCVQHQLKALPSDKKMDGKVQELYPRKNWSSMMVFDNERCTVLTPDMVSSANASTLHQMHWAEKIGFIPMNYNHLVGYPGYSTTDVRGVHFTDGVPTMPGHEDDPFAEEWRLVQRRAKPQNL